MIGLEIGSPAPDFVLPDQHGGEFKIADLRGQKSLLIVFYPAAFSNVCTGELTGFRDHLELFDSSEMAIAAISCDPIFSIRALADRDALFFPLLSDFWPHGAVTSAYGVLDERTGQPRRSSYVVDRAGRITWALHNPPGQARDMGEQAAALRAAR